MNVQSATRIQGLCVGVLSAVAAVMAPKSAFATYTQVSAYGTSVGQDDGDNEYLFCETSSTNFFGISMARAHLQRTDAKGNVLQDEVARADADTSVRMQCFADPELQGSPVWPALGIAGDSSTVACPWFAPYGGHIECNLAQVLGNPFADPYQRPFVYESTACGDGAYDYTVDLVSQITGQDGYASNHPISWYYLDQGLPEGVIHDTNFFPPLYGYFTGNNTYDRASIVGMDIGVPLFSNGKLHFLFGDADVYPPNGGPFTILHQVMATASTVAPWLGFYYEFPPGSWYGTSYDPATSTMTDPVADQLVANTPDEFACNQDFGTGAVPQGAFSFTENGNNYKYMTLLSVFSWSWNPSTPNQCVGPEPNGGGFNRGTIAYSVNDGPWQRLDADYPNSGFWWDSDSTFMQIAAVQRVRGPDAGYIYLYGTNANEAYNTNDNEVHLARVEATHSKVIDKSQYEYWNDGLGWQPDEQLASNIPIAGFQPRDFTVTWNPYLNRYLMIAMQDGSNDAKEVNILESRTLTGRFAYLGHLHGAGLGHYNPQAHVRMMSDRGKHMTVLVSDAFAYNVGLWTIDWERHTLDNCIPDLL